MTSKIKWKLAEYHRAGYWGLEIVTGDGGFNLPNDVDALALAHVWSLAEQGNPEAQSALRQCMATWIQPPELVTHVPGKPATTKFLPNRQVLIDRRTFYQCGCCDHYHSVQWDGDCRQDNARFTTDQLNEMFGDGNWVGVEQL